MSLKKEKFDWGSFLKTLAIIGIPVAMQNLLTTTGSMVDTFMIAPLGQNTVGAVGLCSQFMTLMFSGYYGFVGGGMLFLSQYWGAKDDKGIAKAYGMTLVFMMLVAFTFFSFAVFAPNLIMSAYTNKPSIQQIGIKYLRIVGFAYPFQVFSMVLSTVLRSTERVRIPLIGSICAIATNIFMNWVLIYGHLGAPTMGVEGAALATVIGNVINVLVVLAITKAKHYKYIYMFRDHFRWSAKWVKQYLTKCFPIICNEIFAGIGVMVINMVMGRQAEQTIAAWAVFKTFEGIIVSFFMGFTNAASILVGKSIGAGELKTAYRRAIRLAYLCSATILLAGLILIAIHTPLLYGMSLKGESFDICFKMLVIYIIFAIVRLGNWIQNDTFRAAGNPKFGSILELAFMYLLVLPAVCITGLYLHSPIVIVLIMCYIDEPIRYVVMQHHLYSGKWIKPVTPQGIAKLDEFMKELHNR